MPDLMIPALAALGVLIGIALLWWMSPARNRPTEAQVINLMTEAYAAERHLKQLLDKSDGIPDIAMLRAQHEVAVHKARRYADCARWAATDAGRKAGIIEDVSW